MSISASWTTMTRGVALPWTLVSLGVAGAAGLFIAAYRDWRALGPGGLPVSLRGFLACLYLHATLARSDTLGTAVYAEPAARSAPGWAQASEAERRAAHTSYLPAAGLPVRVGKRARARAWVVPQRERDAFDWTLEAEVVGKAYLAAFERLADEYAGVVEWRTSVMERRGRALFLAPASATATPQPPTLAAKSGGEVAHIHATDLSGHVTLSFADASAVVARGWGERHRLSGNMLQLGYTMTYIPRSLDEVEVYMAIFRAGIEYMRAGK